MLRKTPLRWFIHPVAVGGALLVGGALFLGTFLLAWLSRPAQRSPLPATAVLNILPAPSDTPTPVGWSGDGDPSASPSPTAPPNPGDITIGAFVQIQGTGGDGLRLRAEPGLSSQVRFVALESEVFRVVDGPREVANYTWWYLVAPADESVSGWGVANYLAVVQNP
ncbi:MAG: hypothetical protein PHS96_12910 [Anaerolineales bacterium]|nr:hypothetical protein [Anaerolineales bacterium]